MPSTPSEPSVHDSTERSSNNTPTRHTPGPWRWDPHDDYRRVICDVRGDPQDKEIQANVRLIAAAPALLDAAQEVLQALLPDYPDTAHLCDMLAGAVALATGRQLCNCVGQHSCEQFRGLPVTQRED